MRIAEMLIVEWTVLYRIEYMINSQFSTLIGDYITSLMGSTALHCGPDRS